MTSDNKGLLLLLLLLLLLSVLLSSLHVFKHMSGDNRMDKRKRGTIVTTAGNFFMSTEGQGGWLNYLSSSPFALLRIKFSI